MSLEKSSYEFKNKNFRSNIEYVFPSCVFFQERLHAGKWGESAPIRGKYLILLLLNTQMHTHVLSDGLLHLPLGGGTLLTKLGPRDHHHMARSANTALLSPIIL